MTRPPAPSRTVEIVGARTHNLRGVSCSIGIGDLTVVTGPSGSGKSSLAFDTLYAEGQRRFVESMSTYARQFLERMERPDVEKIEHVLPAIAIAQRAATRTARSTVGTATEIDDVLRLLFAAAGETVCPDCGVPVARDTPAGVVAALRHAFGEGARLLVSAPRAAPEPGREVPEWIRAGFLRAVDAEGSTVDLAAGSEPPRQEDGRVLLLAGRHVLRAEDPELLRTVETAFDLGEGELRVERAGEPASRRRFHRGLVCNGCGRAFRDPVPALFSFHSPRGACPACEGFGRIVGIDAERVVPNPALTIDERPIAPFNSPAYESAYDDLRPALKRHKVRRDVPWKDLTDEERDVVWNGRGAWYGVKGLFDWLEKKRYKVHVRVLLSRYRGYTLCEACGGTRLCPEALHVRVGGRTLPELQAMPLAELCAWLDALAMPPAARERAGHLVADVRKRAGTLVEIGLSYLTLARQTRTLSGGEAQRVQLGSALGNALTGTLYVLDEPTVGLHPRDTARLLAVLRRLASAGNAVVAVEHDLDVIRAADRVLDLGPAAGVGGGRLVFAGTPAALEEADTATGRALRTEGDAFVREEQRAAEEVVPFGRRARPRHLTVVGARAHNLKDLTVAFPLGKLVTVSGVSGSGKSSLVVDVLAAGLRRALGKGIGRETDEIGAHDRIDGITAVEDVVLVDQSPLGRSERSNPATSTKAWDEVRALFARAPAAKAAGLEKGSFSFNAPGGRCERCEGSGTVTIDMQFLADVVVVCDACDGKRFKPEVLEVRVRGRNVAELLETTVDEASRLFGDVPGIVRRLAPLREAGLSYLRLGQPTASLSGGEAQRLKVASFLGGGRSGPTLFVFDEPTTGLHPADVNVLLAVFRRLLAAGHSIVAVEHHPAFLLASDHLVELGPEGGDAGGRVVFAGTPAEMLAAARTPTADALRETVGRARRRSAAV